MLSVKHMLQYHVPPPGAWSSAHSNPSESSICCTQHDHQMSAIHSHRRTQTICTMSGPKQHRSVLIETRW